MAHVLYQVRVNRPNYVFDCCQHTAGSYFEARDFVRMCRESHPVTGVTIKPYLAK